LGEKRKGKKIYLVGIEYFFVFEQKVYFFFVFGAKFVLLCSSWDIQKVKKNETKMPF